jgi:hypothetical protein
MNTKEAITEWTNALMSPIMIIVGIFSVVDQLFISRSIEPISFFGSVALIFLGSVLVKIESFSEFEFLHFFKGKTRPINKNQQEIKPEIRNIGITVENKEKYIVILLTVMHKEEHNLKFGIMFNQERK